MRVTALFLLFLLFLGNFSQTQTQNQTNESEFISRGRRAVARGKFDFTKEKLMYWAGDAQNCSTVMERIPSLVDTLNATGKYHWQLLDSSNGIYAVRDTVQGIKGSFACIEKEEGKLVFYAVGEYEPNRRTAKGRLAWLAIKLATLGRAEFPIKGEATFIVEFRQRGRMIENRMFLRLRVNRRRGLGKRSFNLLIGFIEETLFGPIEEAFKILAGNK